MAIDKINSTSVSDTTNTSTGAFDLPAGTTGQRPGSPTSGNLRFNTTLQSTEVYDGNNWGKVSPITPVLTSVTGNLYTGEASNLTLAGTGFLQTNLVVKFTPSGGSASSVTVTPSSDLAATVAVPNAIYGQSAGTSIAITVTNSDNRESNTVSRTVDAVPTGGTITTTGSFRVHTFNSSGNFVVPSGLTLSNVEYLIVAGGGCGGDYGAGGGAGGYRCSVPSESSGGGASAETRITMAPATYACTIGAGGAASSQAGYQAGNSGTASSIIGGSVSLSSVGGGLGGWYGNPTGNNGANGGSGGGAGTSEGSGLAAPGAGTSGQGYRGGHAVAGRGGRSASPGAPGGGGAGAAGSNGTGKGGAGQPGGVGVSSSINGSATFRAGGGGGYGPTGQAGGAGGNGGGGDGNNGNTNGIGGSGGDNTGGGGGGATGSQASNNNPGAGGSGVVIIRYVLP